MMTHGFLVIASLIKLLLISNRKLKNLIIHSSLSVCLSVYQVEELDMANWQGKWKLECLWWWHTLLLSSIPFCLFVCLCVCLCTRWRSWLWQTGRGNGQYSGHQTGVLVMVTHTNGIIRSSLTVCLSVPGSWGVLPSIPLCLCVCLCTRWRSWLWKTGMGKGQYLRHQTGVLVMVIHNKCCWK